MEKTGEAKFGVTKCSACHRPAVTTKNGHLCCEVCSRTLEKKASDDPAEVFFPKK